MYKRPHHLKESQAPVCNPVTEHGAKQSPDSLFYEIKNRSVANEVIIIQNNTYHEFWSDLISKQHALITVST
jgi:hypothetical protein